ncbi:hypothetical protein C882_2341 [Caenispirillum salinarum AK4]|uniref:ABC3 transporter permease C-terminal domain-containing protein n=1 Tax=Caenispirillum salinarum AK4 TaxID=1238182 RepID=K9H5A7_9PROT|nr:FtsX-like permease family protein [Caenispirillum salinarum]EKV32264.1 hypothetical protein C882_2341 [Caenispirillum salinarum AK4]
MSSKLRRLGFACVLGWRDLRHEAVSFGCQVLALAAVIAPLLVLYGLKSGVMGHLTDELASDVRTLQVSVLQEAEYDAEWIAAMRARPEVGFIQAHTRTLAATVEIIRRSGDNGAMHMQRASLLASGAGDPLLPEGLAAPGDDAVVLSSALATALDAAPGSTVEAVISRRLDGAEQNVFLALRVAGVVAPGLWDARGALVSLNTLVDVERWRDGNAVPRRGWTDGRADGPRGESYPNIRLYASGLDAVEPLVTDLTAMGFDVRSRLGDVKAIQGLDRSLTAIFVIITVVAALGVSIAFGATLWSNVARKTAEISLIRLQGMERGAVAGFPVAQAVMIAVSGVLLATGMATGTCATIDAFFSEGLAVGTQVCSTRPDHVLTAAAGTVVLSLIASFAAANVVARIDPSKGLTDV